MQNSRLISWILGVCFTNLSMAPAAHAEIYKWVDADGRTHYSESKEAAGNARAEQLKLNAKPTPEQEASSSTQQLQERTKPQENQEQIKKNLGQARNETNERPKPAMPPRSLSEGREDGTDASRCALARDVLSGAVKHSNGATTDTYDIKVAKNDVRRFCH